MADYERVTEMNTQVENAVATLRWTGSWYTVFITAEPKGAGNAHAGSSQGSSNKTSIAIVWPVRTLSWSRRSTCRCRSS